MTATPTRALAAAAVGVAKHYGGVQALDGVDLEIQPGRVHAVVGGNGAGKSTLMKILAGAETPDAGQVIIRGEERRFADVADARRAGVSIVFQELSLFPHLAVLSNIAAFSVRAGVLGRLDRRAMARIARPIMDELGLDVPLDAPVRSLALNDRQLVEIARALVDGASVLILDEPNSALNLNESERLFAVIDRLRASGTAILYVSHRLDEVVRIADTITVLRDGRVVGTFDGASATVAEPDRSASSGTGWGSVPGPRRRAAPRPSHRPSAPTRVGLYNVRSRAGSRRSPRGAARRSRRAGGPGGGRPEGR